MATGQRAEWTDRTTASTSDWMVYHVQWLPLVQNRLTLKRIITACRSLKDAFLFVSDWACVLRPLSMCVFVCLLVMVFL